jgi:endonuclease YncB( thermonuclease family)
MSTIPNEQEGRAKAVQVYDGDSFLLQTASQRAEVRLARVRAPEKWHPNANAARALLERLVMGRTIYHRRIAIDVYDRWVCEVWYYDLATNRWVSVNDAMRAAGYTDMGR